MKKLTKKQVNGMFKRLKAIDPTTGFLSFLGNSGTLTIINKDGQSLGFSLLASMDGEKEVIELRHNSLLHPNTNDSLVLLYRGEFSHFKLAEMARKFQKKQLELRLDAVLGAVDTILGE